MIRDMHWIGIDKDILEEHGIQPGRQIAAAFFYAEAELARIPDSLVIRITGRSQYKLFVNDRAVVFGPLRGKAYVAMVDEPDIAPWLRPGKNTLTVQVMSYPSLPESGKQEGPANCFPDDGGPGIAASGLLGDTDLSLAASWRTAVDTGMAFNDYQVFLAGANECVDLREREAVLDRLREGGGDALPCAVDLEPYCATFTGERLGRRFEKRPIPALYRREREYAAAWRCDERGSVAGLSERETVGTDVLLFQANACGHIVLDAGGLTTAFPRFTFTGGAGARVRFTYAECFTKGGEGWNPHKEMRDDATGFLDGNYDEVTVLGSGEAYEPFRFRTFRYIRLDVETGDEALRVNVHPFTETAYPLVNDKRPAFADEKKEKLYDVALRTLQLCMHDTYEDCPYYEQLQYASDSRLEMLFTYRCSSDTRLQEYAIDLFASSLLPEGLIQSRFPSRKLQVIPGFSLYFVLMLEDYIRATGRTEKMAAYIPTAERIIEGFLAKRRADGLIAPRGFEEGYWEYWDWTKQWDGRAGTPNAIFDCGVSTLENLVFVYALQSLCRILPMYHRQELAAHYLEEAGKVQDALRTLAWDTQKGMFREAPGYDEYSQHSQIFAVLTGTMAEEEMGALMEKVLTDPSLVQCSFVQRFYLFRALEKAGMYGKTEELWTDWQRMVDLHCTTFPETPYAPRSECHAWSALPLYEFS